MLRIILLGRTGNNLFQYAFGRVLAERYGVPLVLDGSWFNAAGWEQVSHFLRLPLKAKVVRRCSLGARALRKATGKHYWEYRGVPVLRERSDDQSFDPILAQAPANCVLFGYFQTSLYFESMATALRTELRDLIKGGAHASRVLPSASCGRACERPSERACESSIERSSERSSQRSSESSSQTSIESSSETSSRSSLESSLSSPNSVAVHVRRGDFLSLPVFQVCDSGYQRRAMDRMREWLDKPKFYIFSDDPAWCRSEFTDRDQVVVDSGAASANPLHDLHLMSLASHHVIVNSSYSWWAAWLGEKPGQRVIMPERWFAGEIAAPIEEKRMPHWEVIGG